MNDHIGKPVDPDHLPATLLRWLAPAETPPPASPAPRQTGPAAAPAGMSGTSGKPSASGTSGASGAASVPLEVALAAVEGLDLPAALRSVGGRVTLLERILRKFIEHYGGDTWSLADPRQHGLPALRAACHALRGACATIGAVALARALHELESAAAAPEGDPAALAEAAASVRADLKALLQGLGQALAAGAA